MKSSFLAHNSINASAVRYSATLSASTRSTRSAFKALLVLTCHLLIPPSSFPIEPSSCGIKLFPSIQSAVESSTPAWQVSPQCCLQKPTLRRRFDPSPLYGPPLILNSQCSLSEFMLHLGRHPWPSRLVPTPTLQLSFQPWVPWALIFYPANSFQPQLVPSSPHLSLPYPPCSVP